MFGLKWWRMIIPLVFIALFGALLWRSLSQDPHLLPSTMINKKVPDFKLASVLAPQTHWDQSVFQHHVSVLQVVASWCAVCQMAHPNIMRLSQTPQLQWVALDYRDQRSAMQSWLKHLGNPYRVVLFDPSGALADNLGVYGTPESFLVDQRGIIRDKVIGPLTQKIWRQRWYPEIKTWEAQA